MGNDASSMQQDATISQKTSNIHAIEQKEMTRNLTRSTEQMKNNGENQSIQDTKVEKHYHRYSFPYVLFFLQFIRHFLSTYKTT
jgi:hypothetical protein